MTGRNLDLNLFLNALTDDEFTEFISNRDLKFEAEELQAMNQGALGSGFYQVDQLMETGKQSEVSRVNLLQETMEEQAPHAMDEHLDDIKERHEVENEFKVFRDPTFADFIKIFGKSYNPDLPLYAQLYVLKEILAFYHFYSN